MSQSSKRYRTRALSDQVQLSTFSNGLRLVSEHVGDARSFALGIWIDVGSRDETPQTAGVAHFIEHAAFRRSSTRNSRQIAAQFESLGAYINAFTSKEQTCYYVRALTPHFQECLKLLSDVVLHPVFRESDIEKERGVILEELKSYEDEAEEVILDMVETLLFGNHPLGAPIAGYAATVAKLSAKQIKEFHRRHYAPPRMLVAVASSLPHEEVLEMVENFFPRSAAKSHSFTRRVPKQKEAGRTLLSRPFQQSHISLARRTGGVRHENRWAYSLLNTILGDGMSSRLHQRIRERLGVAYSLYSSLQLLTDCGVLSIYAGTERSTLKRTEKLIERELMDLYTKGVRRTELHRAKEQVKSSIIMGLESMSARMHSLAKAVLEEKRFEEVEASLAAIDAVSMEQMTALCRELCHPSEWSRVLIEASSDIETL